jgi:hypothetical protein
MKRVIARCWGHIRPTDSSRSSYVASTRTRPLSAAQNAGNTLVVGVPNFVPLKNGKTGSAEHKPEDGSS